MELTPSQVERINRRELSRNRKRTPSQDFNRVMTLLAVGFSALILGILLIIHSEWSPGNQEAILADYKAYRALRHNAVAVEEWK